MKKDKKHLLPVVALVLLIFSCDNFTNLETPSSLVVKSKGAKYSVPIGNYSVQISDQINANILQTQIGSAMGGTQSEADAATGKSLYVYDYNPSGASGEQNFIIHYPITTVSLNPAKYLKDFKLEDKISDKLNRTIPVPSVSVPITQPIGLPDINGAITKAVNTEASPVQFKLVEPGLGYTLTTEDSDSSDPYTIAWKEGASVGGVILPSLTQSFDIPLDFDTMTFESGTLEIKITKADSNALGTYFSAEVQVMLLNSKGESISGTEKKRIEDGLEGTDPLKLPLASFTDSEGNVISPVTLEPHMTLRLAGTLKDGSPGKLHTYNFALSFSKDTQIDKITGLNMDPSDMGSSGKSDISVDIPLTSVSDYLVSATIATGNIDIKAQMPTGWTGVTAQFNPVITGGIDAPFDDAFTDLDDGTSNMLLYKRLDLAYSKITPSEPATLQGTLTMSLKDATLLLSGTQTCNLNSVCNITEAREAIVKISALTKNTALDPVPVTFPQDMRNYVTSMKITQLGVSGTLESDLAADGLNVTVSMDAPDINIVGVQSTADIFNGESLEVVTADGWAKEFDLSTQEGFSIQLGLAITGAGGGDEVTLSEVKFGKNYYIRSRTEADKKVRLLFEWEYVVLNTSQMTTGFQKNISTGLSIGSLFEKIMGGETSANYKDIIEQIRLEGIEGYVYLTKPKVKDGQSDPLGSIASFEGTIKAMYDGNTEGTDLIDPTKSLSVVTEKGDFALLADKNRMITSKKLFEEGAYSAKTLDDSFATVINERPDNLSFDCDIHLAGVDGNGLLTLYREDFGSFDFTFENSSGEEIDTDTGDTDTEDVAIKVSIAMVVPLKLKIADDVVIDDLLAFVGQERTSDLLDRETASDKSSIKDYTSLVKEVFITYKIENNTGLNMTATLTATGQNESEPWLTKTMTFNGSHDFSLTSDEVAGIFEENHYPFIPTISVTIAGGDVKIPRDGTFGVSAVVGLVTDGEYTVWGDDKE